MIVIYLVKYAGQVVIFTTQKEFREGGLCLYRYNAYHRCQNIECDDNDGLQPQFRPRKLKPVTWELTWMISSSSRDDLPTKKDV